MNPLDLTRLNFRSPYMVWENERGFSFKTDHGIFYSAEFDREISNLNVVAYWFNLTNNSQKNSPNDEKIRETVVCVIEEFFRVNPDILLYICDTANNQQAMRARLFLRWFNKFAESKDFVIKTAEVKSEEESDYVALIIQKSHPSFDDIIALFESEITMFQTNKNPEDTFSTDSHIDA